MELEKGAEREVEKINQESGVDPINPLNLETPFSVLSGQNSQKSQLCLIHSRSNKIRSPQ
jgi:hypothetical protein